MKLTKTRLISFTRSNIVNFKFYFGSFITVVAILILKDLNYHATTLEAVSNPLFEVESESENSYAKQDSSFLWSKLFRGDLLAAPLKIQTMAASKLGLRLLNSNGYFSFGESTQVALNQNDSEIKLDFTSGEVFASYHIQKSRIPLEIYLNGSKAKKNKIEIYNADIFLRSEGDNNLALSVNYGQIDVFKEGRVTTLKSGEVLRIVGNSQFEIFEPEIKFITPLNQDRFTLIDQDHLKVRIAWKTSVPLKQYKVLMGASSQELRPFFSRPLKLEKNETVLDLGEGLYYLRLEGEDSTKKYSSDLLKLVVERQVPVKPIFPAHEQVLIKNQNELDVKFQWENPSQFEKLFLEISRTAQFNDLIFHETIESGNYFLINFEKTGSYYWRVNGFPKKSSKLILGDARKLIIR